MKLFLAPALSQKFREYVANGGTLVLDFRSGVKDEHNIAISQGHVPCLLDDLCGLRVTEYDCLRDCTGRVRWDGEEYECRMWSDIVETTTAEPLAEYAAEFYAGTPAITRNGFGRGQVYYIGTQMSPALADRFAEELALRPLLSTPSGVEAVHREKDGVQYLFVLNHTDKKHEITLDDGWKPYEENQGNVISPYGILLYTMQTNN